MRPNLLANFAASWHPDPSVRAHHAALMQDRLALHPVQTLPSGWVVGIRPLPRTSTNDVFSEAHGLIIAQGPHSMSADTRSAETLTTLAERVLRRPLELGGYPGDFAVALLATDGECHLACTPAALPPLYYAQDAGVVTVASRLDWIAALRPGDIAVDGLPLALWASATPLFLDGRTVVKGIRRIGRGSRLELRPGATPLHADLTTAFLGQAGADRTATRHEVAGALRRHVLDKLATELVSDGMNLLSLSGGMDSSALAVLVRAMGKPFKAVSLLPANPEPRGRELSYIRDALGERYPQDWIEIPWLHKEYQTEVLSKAPVILHPVLHPVLCELPDLQRKDPIITYFGGEFCDELIGGAGVIAEWCADTSFRDAWRRTPIAMQRGSLRFRQYLVQRLNTARRRPPVGVPEQLATHFDAGLRREYSRWLVNRRRSFPTDPAALTLSRWHDIGTPAVDMNWEAASELNIRRSFPLMGREVLGLLWRTAPSLRLGPGYKELFRQAFGQDVPARILNRPDKGVWGKFLGYSSASPRSIPSPAGKKWRSLQDHTVRDIISSERVAPYAAIPGSPGYAVKVVERAFLATDLKQGSPMNQDKHTSAQASAMAEHAPTDARYEPPRIQKGGNISSVTQGAVGAVADTTVIGSR